MMGGVRCGPREVRQVVGDRGASGVQGRARLQIGSRARGGAHDEHVGHGCDAGGVEADRLVERRCPLPRVERRAYDTGRSSGREAGVGERPRCKRCALQGRARLQTGGRARGGAHPEHAVHVRNAGGVEAQRLVERRRDLPRVKRREFGAGRGAEYREAEGGVRPWCKRRAGEGSTADWGQGTGRSAPRTCRTCS